MKTKKRASSTTKKSSTAKATSAKRKAAPQKEVSRSAIKLINQGAGLLRKAVLKTEAGTMTGRSVVRSKGLDLIDQTSKALHALINSGSGTVAKGLKKL
jgi:hypothetical protein